jgi:acyl-CoA thioesterase-1
MRKVLMALGVVLGILAVAVTLLLYRASHGRPVPPARPDTVKIACVGDSITYGHPFFESDRYPYQLEELLGSGYSVRNFGASGNTVQRSGDPSYWVHPYFKLSSDFEPDVVVIMLGTNDSKAQNWAGVARLAEDYRALIGHYQSLPSHPRIFLVTPPRAFLVKGRDAIPYGIRADVVDEIASSVRTTAKELDLPLIDVNAATTTHAELFAQDGVHPDAAGSRLVAETIFQALSSSRPRV